MKKIFHLLLLTAITLQGQTTGVNKLKIAANPEKTTAPRVMVQETNGDVGYVAKSSIQTDISGKVDKVVGKELSSNDYTTAEKNKLAGIASGAEVNVNADWNAISGDAQILNKPTIPSIAGLATETFVNNGLSTKENTITTGTTSQYWRGDKTWQTLPSGGTWGSITGTLSSQNDLQSALNLKENTTNKNTANGYAGLGSAGKLFSNQLPSIAITDTFVVGSQAAMLALAAETGDVAVRTDVNKSFILKGISVGTLADWQELLTPTSTVTSVFGRTGAVTSNSGDYTTAQVTETTNKKYQSDNQALYNDATSSIQTQLNGKVQSVAATSPLGSTGGTSPVISITQATTSSNGYLTSADWNTFNNKQNALTNPITGTGTTNYIPKFTGASSLGNSLIYDNGTNVGIGTTSPIGAGGAARWLTINGTTTYGGGFISSINGTAKAYFYSEAGYAKVQGTSGEGIKLEVNAGSTALSIASTSAATFSSSVTATGFFQSSDLRLKDIISRDGDVIKYKWKDKRDDKIHIGYVAQEVQKENPDQVNADEKGILSVNYIEILVQKIKDLENRIKQLEK